MQAHHTVLRVLAVTVIAALGIDIATNMVGKSPDRCEPTPLSVEQRRLVLDCMQEIGWELSDENADTHAQIHQSRQWCERFARGE